MSGIFLNEDCNHFIFTRHAEGIKVTETVLRDFISQYKNTQVTDIALNPNGMISFAPSKVRQTALDKFLQYKEEGKVDDSNAYCQVLYDVYVEQGLDMYSIWIDQCRKDGIAPWISVRMNDCHCNDMEDHLLLSDFFKEKKHLRRVTHRKYAGYFDNNIDYGQEEARTYYLDYIRECLENYDMDGLEIDWSRELFCFKLGQEHHGIAILNDFMRTVKQMVDESASKRGHPIKIGVRVAHSPITSLKLGFDVMTWVKEGLVDMIVPAPRWETTDNDMAIDFWKRMVEGTSVELAAGMELLLRPHQTAHIKSQTMETTVANAIVNLSNGADKTYLFNFMDLPAPYVENPAFRDYPVSPCRSEDYPTVLRSLGSMETLLEMPRRHVVSYHDIEAPGTVCQSILPIEIDGKDNFKFVRIENGVVPAGKKVTLIIAARAKDAEQTLSAEDLHVYVNSSPVKCVGPVTPPFAYVDIQHYAFEVENTDNFPYASVAEFATKGSAYVIEHVELRVD